MLFFPPCHYQTMLLLILDSENFTITSQKLHNHHSQKFQSPNLGLICSKTVILQDKLGLFENIRQKKKKCTSYNRGKGCMGWGSRILFIYPKSAITSIAIALIRQRMTFGLFLEYIYISG